MASNMEIVTRDGGLVELILGKLQNSEDRLAASLVCKAWRDAVTWQASRLTLRNVSTVHHVVGRLGHVKVLDLSTCDEQITDSDLEFLGLAFSHLRSVTIGQEDTAQGRITDEGVLALAGSSPLIESASFVHIIGLRDRGMISLSNSWKNLRSLSLVNCRYLGDDALEAITKFSSLRELRLTGSFKFTPTGLVKIGVGCPGLVKVCLELGSTNIDPALISLARSCLKLQEISIKCKKAKLEELGYCSSLISLAVETQQGNDLDAALLAIASGNKKLSELVFVKPVAPLSDSAVIGVIFNCPNLKKLYVDAGNLSDVSLLSIAAWKNLEELALDHLHSTGQGLAAIGMCGLNLKSFTSRNASCVRDDALQTLMAGSKMLEHLNLRSCRGLTSIGFSSIGTCRNLESLDLSSTDVDDLSLITIARGAKHVKKLELVNCARILSMDSVAVFTALESLNVDQCSFVTDEGLDALTSSCLQLRVLSVAFTRITDFGLLYLTMCTKLRSLRVAYCGLVLGDGLIAIAKLCPGLQHVTMSYRFRDSNTYRTLKMLSCSVTLEMDELAVIPFVYQF